MDKVTYVKNKFRQEQWEKLIADCQNSGLKVGDWCLENNISRHAYYYWLRKIRRHVKQYFQLYLSKNHKLPSPK